MKNWLLLLSIFCISWVQTGCSDYNKVLKSTDLEYKYSKALEYYDEGEYLKAYPIIEELVALYRGQQRSEKLFYMYAYSDYYLGDYLLASHRFTEFTKTFPTSKYTEECAYMAAYSLYALSPAPKLDQANTYSAISGLQLFIDRYPHSARVDTSNALIKELEFKVEEKVYQGALQYRNMENFTAAVITFENILKDFPDTRKTEDIYFKIYDSYYTLALKSITEKKNERIDEALKAYVNFANRFPQSKYMNEAKQMYAQMEKEKVKLQKQKK